MEMRWARKVSAYSFTVESGRGEELMARERVGGSAGLTLRKEGGLGMSEGSCREAWVMAACTSWAAASMSRSSVNWSVICVRPRVFDEVIESMPAMVENCRSRGVATDEAMVSGLAPGRLAETWMVGKSALGRSLTGKAGEATTPNRRM